MNTYDAVIEYLYARLTMFTRDGATAIKKDVDNTLRFCSHLGNPQTKFKSLHVGGTNGKGSTSHMLASILASAGYKTGLYTSPHLVDFRERIRINGHMIEEERVVRFVQQYQPLIEEIKPSFFEVTVALAFDYFAKEHVDIAIIEVGLGGRLDSTNIIRPELSLITNIGMDHMNLLGDTVQEIAFEKAGIIKSNIPVIVSERDNSVAQVFQNKAAEMESPLCFASDRLEIIDSKRSAHGLEVCVGVVDAHQKKTWTMELTGLYQRKNLLGVLTAVDELRKQGWDIDDTSVQNGLLHVSTNTGLRGRWQTLSTSPWIICDTGHNEDGIREVVNNLNHTSYRKLHVVIGAMRDKDLSHMLPQLPTDANYYFTSPDMPRSMSSVDLFNEAQKYGLVGRAFSSVWEGLQAAKLAFEEGDLIFVGGSTFVVAEVLKYSDK
ncbi:bifunctional folylpolyglutamate synthase/dihydrofolate synthase [Sphingobacterium sp. LRF_L2]|uniref:bifunctional folylpolyglutamate synthase/dihydrofolate synthase n=1 Tax=Sphingobacterium sp. LRF_L2 TaxID=3369421 RepID=UPI003F60723A